MSRAPLRLSGSEVPTTQNQLAVPVVQWMKGLTPALATEPGVPSPVGQSLPTTTQVRALYSSIWGQARDWSNSHRWLHKNNAGVCREVAARKVEAGVDKALNSAPHLMAAALGAGTTANILSAAIAGATSSGLVGISPVAVGTLARALPGVRVAAALTGGAIAYQRSVARGKAPAWFTRTHPERRVLQEPYSPGPEWLQQNQLARTLH